MSNPFFERPIVNSPYEYPRQHWELDETGQPTGHLIDRRRRAEFITPIPKPKKRRGSRSRRSWTSTRARACRRRSRRTTSRRSSTRSAAQVDTWRNLPASQWQVTPETARLLQHWRHHEFGGVRPFFCQIEAVETAIWFTEVAPHLASGKRLLDNLKAVNADANPQHRAARAEARHRRRQDDGDGDADRLADAQRRSPARQQTLHPRLPHRHARPDHPRSPARPAAERPGQLLRHPRAGPARPARGHQEGADRHHELPRLQAPRAARAVRRRTRAARRARPVRSCRRSKPKARCSSA